LDTLSKISKLALFKNNDFLKNKKAQEKEQLCKDAITFFRECMIPIEVVIHGVIEKIYFPKIPFCF